MGGRVNWPNKIICRFCKNEQPIIQCCTECFDSHKFFCGNSPKRCWTVSKFFSTETPYICGTCKSYAHFTAQDRAASNVSSVNNHNSYKSEQSNNNTRAPFPRPPRVNWGISNQWVGNRPPNYSQSQGKSNNNTLGPFPFPPPPRVNWEVSNQLVGNRPPNYSQSLPKERRVNAVDKQAFSQTPFGTTTPIHFSTNCENNSHQQMPPLLNDLSQFSTRIKDINQFMPKSNQETFQKLPDNVKPTTNSGSATTWVTDDSCNIEATTPQSLYESSEAIKKVVRELFNVKLALSQPSSESLEATKGVTDGFCNIEATTPQPPCKSSEAIKAVVDGFFNIEPLSPQPPSGNSKYAKEAVIGNSNNEPALPPPPISVYYSIYLRLLRVDVQLQKLRESLNKTRKEREQFLQRLEKLENSKPAASNWESGQPVKTISSSQQLHHKQDRQSRRNLVSDEDSSSDY